MCEMIFLDTNVLSEVMHPAPNATVVEWLDRQDPAELLLSAVTVAEIWYGVHRLPDGKRKANLLKITHSLFEEEFAQRILPFDEAAAMHYAELVCQREQLGRPISMADAQIASICRCVDGASLATRNVRDFTGIGLALVNPWEAI
jgi:predicted nucleic acid-binding protein